jgi:ornithine decarboxylase
VLAREVAGAGPGPLILISRGGALRALARLRDALPSVGIHYAIKACSESPLLAALAKAGCGFELASAGELPALARIPVSPEPLLCGNPVRALAQTAALHAAGVRLFAADSVEEVVRTAKAAPGARVLLRVALPGSAPGTQAWWPMGDTFGAPRDNVPEIVAAARTRGVEVAGVCFHVGSQCTDPQAWVRGVATAADAIVVLQAAGHPARLLSLGGGFPVEIEGRYGLASGVEAIGTALASALATLPREVELIAEPGRYLVASAGLLLTRVTAVRTHRGQRWLQLDCGMHDGLIESVRGVPHRIRPLRGSGHRVAWRIVGPSCDGADVLPGEWLLPAGVDEGDWLAVEGAAACAQSRASGLNGLPLPVTRIVD